MLVPGTYHCFAVLQTHAWGFRNFDSFRRLFYTVSSPDEELFRNLLYSVYGIPSNTHGFLVHGYQMIASFLQRSHIINLVELATEISFQLLSIHNNKHEVS
jgi:hypothetical protein